MLLRHLLLIISSIIMISGICFGNENHNLPNKSETAISKSLHLVELAGNSSVKKNSAHTSEVVLKKFDGDVEGVLTLHVPNQSHDYFAVKYSLDQIISSLPYKITGVSFYNNDSNTNWPKVYIAHPKSNGHPDLSQPLALFRDVKGPDQGFAEIQADITVTKMDDIFFVIQMPPDQSLTAPPPGKGSGPGIGIDISGSYINGNLYSVNGSTFTELRRWNLGVTITIEKNTTAVPVKLSSFSVEGGNGFVSLKWSTKSESNNFGFEIERGHNQTEFSKIGFVSGKHTTTIPQQYDFLDENLPAGTYYYRLKQVDCDGSFEYSAVVETNVISSASFLLEQNYPNPFNPVTHISYYVKRRNNVKLKIFNYLGQEIRTLVDESREAGYYSVTWDGKDEFGFDVPSSIYFYRMLSGSFQQSKRMILIR